MAASAASFDSMVTNPKPRGRPLNLSMMRSTSITAPCAAKRSWSWFSVVLKERFPTNNLVFIDDFAYRTDCLSRLFPTTGFQIITEYFQLKIYQALKFATY